MTQSSSLGNIINMARTLFRGKVNDCFKAVTTQNAGDSPPDPPYENMFWFDTANGLVKLRDPSNSYWQTIGVIGPPFQWTNVSERTGVLSAGTTSGNSSIITGINSAAIAMDIVLIGVRANTTVNFELQLGTSGGLLTSGYAAVTEEMGNTNTYTTTRFALAVGVASTDVMIGTFQLFKGDSNRWNLLGSSSSINSPYNRNHIANGTVVLPSAIDRVGLLTSAGAFVAGGYSLRWYS